MSLSEPIEPNPQAAPSPSAKPDWLVGADEGASAEAERPTRPMAPMPPARRDPPDLKLVPGRDEATAEPDDSEATTEAAPEQDEVAGPPAAETAGTNPWKAAASSVPRLRQQPAARAQLAEAEAFQGFAQDALPSKGGIGGPGMAASDDGGGDGGALTPLATEPPFWAQWLEQLRVLPKPVMIGAVVVVALGAAVWMFFPRGTPGVSLAQIRQRPEAFEGRSVHVNGRAGEAFSVGGSYVFDLYQGRDTIVVYSRTSPPRLNQRVGVDGTVSIGYLDGVARVALLENP